jgi:hypothetical protein
MNKDEGLIDTLKGQLRVVDEVNAELGVIGMTGSMAWKAQMLRLNNHDNRWIPVSERLPDVGDYVLWSDGISVSTTTYVAKIGFIASAHATHWQSLPPLPEE